MGAEITIVAYGLRKNKQERQRYNKEQYKHYYTAHYQATIAGPSTACRGAEAKF